MTASELMDMVRRSALDFVSYDRSNLKEEDFYGTQDVRRYYSVIHFVENYGHALNKAFYDSYIILNEDVIIHFDSSEKMSKYIGSNFYKGFPKASYYISYADREKFYRRDSNLEILLD